METGEPPTTDKQTLINHQVKSMSNNNIEQYHIYSFIFQLLYNLTPTPTSFTQHKYYVLKQTMENPFLQKPQKENIITLFQKTQRTYTNLQHFLHIYRVKKSTTKTDTDLYLNPINPDNPNAVLIYQNNSKYWFMLGDLIRHIETSLIHSPFFFAEPIYPRNPYNNIPFSSAILYTIYFRIKSSSFLLPIIFHHFFLCEFNLTIFVLHHEYLIREAYIKQYIYNTDPYILTSTIKSMMNGYMTFPFIIDKEFPKQELLEIMRPYLFLFFIGKNHISGTEKVYVAREILKKKLNEFQVYNTCFGMKMKKSFENTYEFNKNHPKFSMKETYNYGIDMGVNSYYT